MPPLSSAICGSGKSEVGQRAGNALRRLPTVGVAATTNRKLSPRSSGAISGGGNSRENARAIVVGVAGLADRAVSNWFCLCADSAPGDQSDRLSVYCREKATTVKTE